MRTCRELVILSAIVAAAACGDRTGEDGDANAGTEDAARVTDASDMVADAAGLDAGPGGFVPTSVRAELIASGPARVATPSSWNAHLSKLVGDSDYLYAVHTHYPGDVASRYAAIMQRPIGGGAWTEVARVQFPHQPPGLAMDTGTRLHMVFDCLRPGGSDVTCFQGGAGTGGLTSRFYHLIFSARDGAGALRFDTYANHNEWTAESNGYHGIGVTSDGVTVWSLVDASWQRVVQTWTSSGWQTLDTLSRNGVYLLYPITAAPTALGSDALILYMGEFDPGGGNNASYVASTAYLRDGADMNELFRRAPPDAPAPGTVAAYPSDIAFDGDDVLFALSYLPEADTTCTELLRFDAGLAAAPTILDAGCQSTYTKIQIASDGTLYLLTGGSGANVRVGISVDRGSTWTTHDVSIAGLPANGDVRYGGFAIVKPYSSPALYDPDVFLFTFAGFDTDSQAQHSYLGRIALAP